MRRQGGGEALLRRRRHRVPGHRPRVVRGVVPRGGAGHRAAGPRRGDGAPAGGVGGAVLRARGRRGVGARRPQARGVRRGAPGTRFAAVTKAAEASRSNRERITVSMKNFALANAFFPLDL
jgi:hypothetical protein